MKEYLVKKNGKLILATSETKLSSSVIVVPCGADIYVQFNSRMKVFYKENFKYVYQDGGWSETSYTDENIKYWNNLPVLWRREQEIKMKEYLRKNINGEFELIRVPEQEAKELHADSWLEVPEGAELLTQDDSGTLTFWNEDDSFNVGINNEWISPQDGVLSYREYCKQKFTILWCREKTVEYLDPYDWSLQVVGENIPISGSWIKVPEGAEQLTKSGLELVFWKDDGKFSWHTENSTEWDDNIELDLTTLSAYGKEYIVWQRHTQPEELPFIDDEPDNNEHHIDTATGGSLNNIGLHYGFRLREIFETDDGYRASLKEFIKSKVLADNINNSPYEIETKSSFNSEDIKYMDGCAFGKTQEITERNASDIADAALKHIRERAVNYDQADGERSAAKTAKAFNAITGKDITESEVWLMLQLLKDVRQWSRDEYHVDSAEDCIAYAALKAESLEKSNGGNN
ncbi:hypothetical protein [Acinetobacter phage HFM1]|nr:hypothetical protein [Acinetobacter phage HFM1]